MEFLQSLLRRDLARKLVVASGTIGCSFTPLISAMEFGLLDFRLLSPVLDFQELFAGETKYNAF